MKKYFEDILNKKEKISISKEQFDKYKKDLITELKRIDAEDDIHLISDELIINAISNGHTVEDVAWALIQ